MPKLRKMKSRDMDQADDPSPRLPSFRSSNMSVLCQQREDNIQSRRNDNIYASDKIDYITSFGG